MWRLLTVKHGHPKQMQRLGQSRLLAQYGHAGISFGLISI